MRKRPLIKWLRIREETAAGYGVIGETPNAQRPTSNAQSKRARFDLEGRLLAFSARIIEIVDALPSTRAANLRLVQRAKFLPDGKTLAVLGETEELIKIFFASIRTAERNGR